MSSSDKGVLQCSEAVVNHYGVTFSCLGSSLEKLNTKQEALSGAVQREGERLNEERAGHRVEQMISVTNIYKWVSVTMMIVLIMFFRTKLDRVREDMAALGARSARLRQRAARLQEEKQRESMGR